MCGCNQLQQENVNIILHNDHNKLPTSIFKIQRIHISICIKYTRRYQLAVFRRMEILKLEDLRKNRLFTNIDDKPVMN